MNFELAVVFILEKISILVNRAEAEALAVVLAQAVNLPTRARFMSVGSRNLIFGRSLIACTFTLCWAWSLCQDSNTHPDIPHLKA